MDWLSGDQNGLLAPSVPSSRRHGGLVDRPDPQHRQPLRERDDRDVSAVGSNGEARRLPGERIPGEEPIVRSTNGELNRIGSGLRPAELNNENADGSDQCNAEERRDRPSEPFTIRSPVRRRGDAAPADEGNAGSRSSISISASAMSCSRFRGSFLQTSVEQRADRTRVYRRAARTNRARAPEC